jgi:hypothetical protein
VNKNAEFYKLREKLYELRVVFYYFSFTFVKILTKTLYFMKKYMFFTLYFVLIMMQNAIAQTNIEQNKSKDLLSGNKSTIDLMALDSIMYDDEQFNNIYFRFDNRGNIIFHQFGFHKIENTFNEDSLLMEGLFYMWNFDSNAYFMHERTTFSYDNNRNLSEEIQYMFINGAWLSNTKNIYQYTNNLLVKNYSFFFNEETNVWDSSAIVECTYNESNLEQQLIVYNYYNNTFSLSSITNSTYDDNNNLVLTEVLHYESDTILNGYKNSYTYNNNLMVETITELYNYVTSSWVPSNKQEITHNSDGLVVELLTYMYNNNQWNLHRKDSCFYDINNNLNSQQSFINYNEGWYCQNKSNAIFDYNYSAEDMLIPKKSSLLSIYMYPTSYNNMLTHYINSNNYTPDDSNTWAHDTSFYYYSSKSIIVSLPNNIIDNGNELLVYPNPTNDKTIINLSGVTDKLEISIFDIQGKCIEKQIKQPLNGYLETSIDVSNLKKGTYFINLKSNQYKQTKKLIVY